jgi:VWFA-related protein
MRSAVQRGALLLWVVVAAAELSVARRAATAQTSPTTPTFPSAVDLVTVDAVVLDGKGQPVRGLTRDDFVLTEDGRPLTLATFEAVEAPAEPIAPAGVDDAAAIATNVAPPAPGRAYAVLVDDVWIPPLDLPAVGEALRTFLERSVRSGDQVSLASTSGDLHWRARLPEGREDLLAVVSSITGRARAQVGQPEIFADNRPARSREEMARLPSLESMSEYQAHRLVRAAATGLTGAIAQEVDLRRRARMKRTHAALRREIEALWNVVGRKSLFLVTQGFIQDSGPEQQETTRIAHESNVAIYFLDARGLLLTPGMSAADAGAPDPSRVVESLVELDVHDTAGSQDLASDTGGYSVRNTNDLAAGMERITSESRVFYMLGFHPPPGKAPGEWRKLRIAVRRSGLTVRGRRGYWLRSPDGARSIASTGPGASIPLRLASYVLDPVDADSTRVAVALEVDVRGLPVGPGEPPLKVRLEALPRDGDVRHDRDVTLDRGGDRAPGGWQAARLHLALPPDVYRVRAEVEEPTTGRRGIVEQRVAVPAPALFRISTPVLSDTVLPTNDAGAPAPAPIAHRTFDASGSRTLLYGFSVLGAARDKATGQPDVRMRLGVKDSSGRVLVAAPEATVAPASDGRLEQVVGLPLAQMAAGEYELELAIQDRVAGKALERKETFVVEAAPSPAATAEVAPPTDRSHPPPADLAPILERAGRYVVAYQKLFSDLVAEEDYQQHLEGTGWGQQKRHSRADMLFVSLPGPIPWAVFRDVFEVDGQQVRDREARLERLFRESPDGASGAATRAKAILAESARFNLGPVRRTLNIPTLALLVLHPDNQHRFSFERKGTKTIDGTETVQVAFTERIHPTLVGGAAGDVWARGNLWIDAHAGTVLRTEVAYRPDGENRFKPTRTHILTEYGREPRLDVTVPLRMTETYAAGEGVAGMLDNTFRYRSGFDIKAVARYSRYRRFDVTTDEQFVTPPQDP